MNTIVVIPARFQSSRFPGKPLVMIAGKSLIHRVWERCVRALHHKYVFVATDNEEISRHCKGLGIQTVMTSDICLTGTDRVYEASKQIPADVIVNVQGDEPLIDPNDILKIIAAHKERPDCIHNGMCPIHTEEDFRDTTVPKVVAARDGTLLYMSRGAIPTTKKLDFVPGLAQRQVCIYSFMPEALEAFGKCSVKAPLEQAEDIEILRFIDLGYKVRMISLSENPVAIDTPEDVEKAEEIIRERGLTHSFS